MTEYPLEAYYLLNDRLNDIKKRIKLLEDDMKRFGLKCTPIQ